MIKEREGWAEEVVAKLRRAAAYPVCALSNTWASVMTAEAGLLQVAFSWGEIDAQSDEQLAELVKCRVEQQKCAILEHQTA